MREGAADNWAQEITPNSPAGTPFGTATIVSAPFAWNAGFRVGIGYQRGEDDYDTTLYFTNFTTQATNSATGDVYSAFLANFYVSNPNGNDFGPHYQSASMRWNFGFHTLDYEVGRKYSVDRTLTLRPFVGLKAAVIDQLIYSSWQNPIDTSTQTYGFTSATENLKQDFWGIGPSLGMTIIMPLHTQPSYTLKFFGTPSGALMYGHWTFKDQYKNNGPTSTTVPGPTTISINSIPINGAATMARGVMGLEWVRYSPKVTTTVRLGYEAQVWLNQMQFYSFNVGRLNNLMSLQGGILELCVNF